MKLKHDKLLSNLACNFKLRHYTEDGARGAEDRARAAEEASEHAAGESNMLKEMVNTLQIELRRLQQMNAQLRKRLKGSEHALPAAGAPQRQQLGRASSSLSGMSGGSSGASGVGRPPTGNTHVTDVSSNCP